jgi:hypothetical protein
MDCEKLDVETGKNRVKMKKMKNMYKDSSWEKHLCKCL